jgi:hypothetical protein
MTTIELNKYVPVINENGEPTGMLRWVGNRDAREVVADLAAFIKPLEDGGTEYVSLGAQFKYEGVSEIPPFRRVVAYAVTGGSEGHYVHVDLHLARDPGTYMNLMLVKTFGGMAHARKIANAIADVLEV